jgi:hypothetical protein
MTRGSAFARSYFRQLLYRDHPRDVYRLQAGLRRAVEQRNEDTERQPNNNRKRRELGRVG